MLTLLTTLIQKKSIQLFLIIILTFMPYSNILNNNYSYDDENFIIDWQEKKSLENIPEMIKGNVPKIHRGVYRPVRGIIYTFSYQVWGLNPIGYHLQAIIIHLTITILIYFIACLITKNYLVAFLTALLFGTHPIHTEAISFTTASFDTAGIAFFFLSFYLYIKAETDIVKQKIYHLASYIYATLAFFTYEVCLILPLLVILYDFCYKKINRNNLVSKLILYLIYFVIIIFYIAARIFIGNTKTRADNILGWSHFFQALLNWPTVLQRYIELLVIPKNLVITHPETTGYNLYKLVYNQPHNNDLLFYASTFLPVLTVSVLIIIAVKTIKKYPVIPFCIGWFFITLIPVANFIPQGPNFTERYVYTASFSFSLLSALLISTGYNKLPKIFRHLLSLQCLIIFFLVLLISAYSAATILRNFDWKDNKHLWSSVVQIHPRYIAARTSLALTYYKEGDYKNAIAEFQKIHEIDPKNALIYYIEGSIHEKQGELDSAIKSYTEALKYDPKLSDVHNNLGLIYKTKKNFILAQDEIIKALEIKPNDSYYHYNLAVINEESNRLDIAIDEYKKAVLYDSYNISAHNNLGILYGKRGEVNLAINEFKKVLDIDPKHINAHFNLAAVYQSIGQYEAAIKEYELGLKNNPNEEKATLQLQLLLQKIQ